MSRPRNPELIDTLRATLREIEASEKLRPNDPTWQQLKRSILLAIADLEREKLANYNAA